MIDQFLIRDVVTVLSLLVSIGTLYGQASILAMIYEVRDRIEAIEAEVYDGDDPDDGDEAEPHHHDVIELRSRRAA